MTFHCLSLDLHYLLGLALKKRLAHFSSDCRPCAACGGGWSKTNKEEEPVVARQASAACHPRDCKPAPGRAFRFCLFSPSWSTSGCAASPRSSVPWAVLFDMEDWWRSSPRTGAFASNLVVSFAFRAWGLRFSFQMAVYVPKEGPPPSRHTPYIFMIWAIILTPSIPLNKPYSSHLYNPLYITPEGV